TTLFAQGLLAIAPGTGEWVAPSVPSGVSYGHLQMPRTVHDAIAERVAGLPYELRDLLATVAVAGRGIRTDLVSSVHGMSRLRAAALADALVERRLLAEEGGVYRCAHPMIAEVVRDGLTPAPARAASGDRTLARDRDPGRRPPRGGRRDRPAWRARGRAPPGLPLRARGQRGSGGTLRVRRRAVLAGRRLEPGAAGPRSGRGQPLHGGAAPARRLGRAAARLAPPADARAR